MRRHTLVTLALLGLLASCIHTSQGQCGGHHVTPDVEPDEEEDEEAPINDTDKVSEEDKGSEEDQEDDEEEPPPKEKTTEIEEMHGLMLLHNVNFARAINENPMVLVEWFAPWCGTCRGMDREFIIAAKNLKEEGSNIRLAKVIGTEETELSAEFDVENYPATKLFINGDRLNPIEMTGKTTARKIVKWLKRHSGPVTTTLDTPEAAAQFSNAHDVVVIGFFQSLESEAAKTFERVAGDMTDAEFAVTTNPGLFRKYGVTEDTVVLIKKFDEGRADYVLSKEERVDKETLSSFVLENSLELVTTLTEGDHDKIFESKVKNHCVLLFNSSTENHKALVEALRTVAKEFKGMMLYVATSESKVTTKVMNFFGVEETDLPTVRVINVKSGKKYALDGNLTLEALREFSRAVVDGHAAPWYRSEQIPEDWNKAPVKVLVGKNFNTVAMDPTKNVFLMFYAPWSKECQKLAPVWEELGEKYADHEDIIIAKMDATANEVEDERISLFPHIMYYPAVKRKFYAGRMDLEAFSKFLDEGVELYEEEEGEMGEDRQEVGQEQDDSNVGGGSEAEEQAKDEL